MRFIPSKPGAFGYLVTFIALAVLATISFGLSRVELGRIGLVVAMLVAALKAALVALFFMHLAGARASVRLTVVLGLLFGGLLIGLVTADVVSRQPTRGSPAARRPG